MSQALTATPLHLHSLDSLLDELVSGHSIPINGGGGVFRLSTPETRAALAWYRDHRDRWSRSTAREDVEAIVDQLGKPAPVASPSSALVGTRQKRTLFLRSVRAHRFAGIHRFGTSDEAPEDFCYTVEKPLTLVEGANSAGKTSFLSAVMWGLTGFAYCPLRPPELANQALRVNAPEGGADLSRVMSPITPMPPAEELKALGEAALPLDTWVELTFVDDAGNPVGPVRRWLQRGPRGSVVVKCSGFDDLGLDTLACEVGTRMPALLPHIQLGDESDLGKAVASLIGIQPLRDLAAHAAKAQARLSKDLVKECSAEIVALDAEFTKGRVELEDLFRHAPSILPRDGLAPLHAGSTADELAAWRTHFERLQAAALADAQAILGNSFNYQDAAAREDLVRNVGPALGLLDQSHLASLHSARRLAALGKVSEAELVAAEGLIRQLQREAQELAELSRLPDLAARLRLYARVAGWMKDHHRPPHALETCPLCQSALAGKTDDITGKAITDHLREVLGTDAGVREKTAQGWGRDAAARLRDGVGPVLQQELNQELPASPAALIARALSQELFASQHLRGCLEALKPACSALCQKVTADLPAFAEPPLPEFPDDFGGAGEGFALAVRRLVRAIAFARWRRGYEGACKRAFDRIIGRPGSEDRKDLAQGAPAADLPLFNRLEALDLLVKTALPVSQALARLTAMTATVSKRRQKQDRAKLYPRAAEALQELLALPTLVEKQVRHLMETLAEGTARWKRLLYSPAFVGAPAAERPEVQADGIITVGAAAQGSQAPAQHVGNTAELRATLFAFHFALWEHMLAMRGGLALLLLDDPQEMFDPSNRRRFANTVPVLVKKGATALVTTLDPEFGRHLALAATSELGPGQFDHRRIHPPKAVRPHIVLGRLVETVEEKRRAFEHPQHENDSEVARDYLKELRAYLENRLCDFFDLPEPGLPKQPTLSDLIGAIRSRHRAGMDAFTSQTFRDLVSDPALTSGSDFLALLNQSHHGDHERIQYADVARVKDLCVRARRLVEAAHEDYERWLRRDPRPGVAGVPTAPEVLRFPGVDVPLFENLAAFTAEAPAAEPVESEERFSFGRLSNHALYVISTHNFGFAGDLNCRAIVDLSEEVVADNRLVVALHNERIYARRVMRDPSKPAFVMLGSDAVDPMRRPPSLHLPAEEVRLLKVVGVLFDGRPHFPRPTEEAVPARDLSCLNEVEIAFKVQGRSAEPLALNGQTVLGGKCLTSEDFTSMEGALVAVATSSEAVFKRVGRVVPGAPHVRHLEAIGGRGSSMLVRTEEVENDPYHEVPLLRAARQVMGVLYE